MKISASHVKASQRAPTKKEALNNKADKVTWLCWSAWSACSTVHPSTGMMGTGTKWPRWQRWSQHWHNSGLPLTKFYPLLPSPNIISKHLVQHHFSRGTMNPQVAKGKRWVPSMLKWPVVCSHSNRHIPSVGFTFLLSESQPTTVTYNTVSDQETWFTAQKMQQ